MWFPVSSYTLLYSSTLQTRTVLGDYLIPGLPPGQQGIVKLPMVAFTGDPRPLPGRARLSYQGLQGHPTPLARRPACPARLLRKHVH